MIPKRIGHRSKRDGEFFMAEQFLHMYVVCYQWRSADGVWHENGADYEQAYTAQDAVFQFELRKRREMVFTITEVRPA